MCKNDVPLRQGGPKQRAALKMVFHGKCRWGVAGGRATELEGAMTSAFSFAHTVNPSTENRRYERKKKRKRKEREKRDAQRKKK